MPDEDRKPPSNVPCENNRHDISSRKDTHCKEASLWNSLSSGVLGEFSIHILTACKQVKDQTKAMDLNI